MRHRLLLSAAIFIAFVFPALAADEEQAQALFREIRCVVCTGESIAESQAKIAADMRRDISERLEGGETPAQIKEYLVSRYGDVILMKPPVKPATWLLWGGPLLILACGAALLANYFRHSGKAAAKK